MAHLVSVNLGNPHPVDGVRAARTSIDRRPVSGPTYVGRLGLAGDRVSNTRHHGGADQAVYAMAREELDRWAGVLGAPVPDGRFGENLTTLGLDVDGAEIGSRWQVGAAVLEVASVRTPCATFRSWMAHCGYDARGWTRRFTEVARPGAYLRVVQEGPVETGDEVTVLHEPGHGVTVSLMFRALHTEPDLLPRLLEVPGMPARARARAARWVADGGSAERRSPA